ncbi:hypothetical protein LR48_Vigan06g068000 [Vigna angularis]|uniref:Uncharacterized protein n=1 Tax=Phaseolus angularis TaxID=3914 RepID=A0A0L9US54_PHAAN|nr:hypothetical protein LR48_Vigan06g068000 [Vigna angularis]
MTVGMLMLAWSILIFRDTRLHVEESSSCVGMAGDDVGKVQRIEVDVGEVVRMEVHVREGDRIEVDVGEGERIKVDVGEVDRIEDDEGDVEGDIVEVDEGHDVEVIEGAHDERTKLNDVEGETMELDEAHDERIEVEELEDIEVEVREWSTSDDNGEVNSMDGLVDINIQCDFRESDNYGNMEVDGSALPESDLEEDDISDTSLFNEEDDVSALPASVVILCYIGSL